MGHKDRREREKAELQNKIFDAASQIVIEEGFENLSMRKIAAKIEYMPPVIYQFFKDKNDIVEQLVAKGYSECIEAIEEILKENCGLPVVDRIRLASHAYVGYMTSHEKWFRMALMSGGNMALNSDDSSPADADDVLGVLLNEGFTEKIFKKPTGYTPQLMIAQLFGLVYHIIGHNITGEEEIRNLTDECLKIVLDGIRV